MKYIFLAYEDEEQWAKVSEGERQLVEAACLAQERELRESGHLFAVEKLQENEAAVAVKVVDGRVSIGDRNSAGANDRLTHLFFINAKDLNEAILVVSKMAQLKKGTVEVRAARELH